LQDFKMLYFEKIQNFFRIKDKNLSEFEFWPFENIWIKGKRQKRKEPLQTNDLKSRQDRIWKYKNIFFIKKDNLIKINWIKTKNNNNLFEGLILHKIQNLEFINENKLKLIKNYKLNYQKVEIFPNIYYFYITNLNTNLLPILNGLFWEYLYSFKYIISDNIRFNLPFEIKTESIENLYTETTNLLQKLQNFKNNKILIWKTLKEKLTFQTQNILSKFIKLITNLYIILINSIKTKHKLKSLQNLPNILEEYKAHWKLLEKTIDFNIERYQLIYQKLSTYFQQYSQLLISQLKNFLKD